MSQHGSEGCCVFLQPVWRALVKPRWMVAPRQPSLRLALGCSPWVSCQVHLWYQSTTLEHPPFPQPQPLENIPF